MTGIEILNKFQAIVIDIAKKNGVSLQEEFGTVEKFKGFVIALTLKSLLDEGMAMNKAYDLVFGCGEYNKMAGKVWEAAR